jgi:hypothetical protein
MCKSIQQKAMVVEGKGHRRGSIALRCATAADTPVAGLVWLVGGWWFVVRGSWFVVRGSWFVDGGRWFVDGG